MFLSYTEIIFENISYCISDEDIKGFSMNLQQAYIYIISLVYQLIEKNHKKLATISKYVEFNKLFTDYDLENYTNWDTDKKNQE